MLLARRSCSAAAAAHFKSIGRAYSVVAGEADFDTIRTERYAYVDKSRYAALLSQKSNRSLFVRPRRQGKTLLLNTTQCLLERKEKLFRGLAVHDEVNWHDGTVLAVELDRVAAVAVSGAHAVLLRGDDLSLAAGGTRSGSEGRGAAGGTQSGSTGRRGNPPV
ncbi:hypothetical protein B484DRAFT_408419 [Ochromonadaceae sp. CCMP2298]|nr:hypothetical protein B484DRAFT_408419 [Ochromonadaceae sp. CCMP2298]